MARYLGIDTSNYTTSVALYNSASGAVSYTHLRAHETGRNLVCRLLLEKKKKKKTPLKTRKKKNKIE